MDINVWYRIPSWVVHLCVWLLVGGIFFASVYQIFPIKLALLKILISFNFIALLFYGNAYGLFPRYFEQKRYLFYAVISLIFLTGVIIIRIYFEQIWLFPYLTTPEQKEIFERTALFRFVSSSSAAYFLGFYFVLAHRWIQQESERNRLKALEYETELRILKNQLSPHFLFNAINNVYSLALGQDRRTAPMLLEISQMLRYLIYRTEGERVKLEDEIQFYQTLITLYSLKYENIPLKELSVKRVQVKHTIAPLLLLPFIENMFKHGQMNSNSQDWILQLMVEDNVLNFKAQNPKDPESTSLEEASGVGIENAKKRLALIYPNQYQLDIQANETLYSVHLILDLDG